MTAGGLDIYILRNDFRDIFLITSDVKYALNNSPDTTIIMQENIITKYLTENTVT